MPIQWRCEMAIDNDAVDHDHQVLIAVINEFFDAGPDEHELLRMQGVLGKLEQYTHIHFAREEKLQVMVRYPYHDAHHQEHQELIRQLARIRGMVDAAMQPEPAPDEATIRHLRIKVDTLLHEWLVDHIIKSDLRMKPYARAMARFAFTLEPLQKAATSRCR
jgi:hemerythrin